MPLLFHQFKRLAMVQIKLKHNPSLLSIYKIRKYIMGVLSLILSSIFFSATTIAQPLTVPSVTTTAITNIASSGAYGGGTVISDGGSAVFERGIVYSTSANPTTADNKIIDANGGTGNFTSNLSGLWPCTLYYISAYAINSVGISYGSTFTFTTACTCIKNICAGDIVELDAVGGSSSQTFTIGNGNLVSTSSNSFPTNNGTKVNPFQNYYGGLKIQYLITAAELYAAGYIGGNLTSLAFDVTQAGPTPFQNFTISLKNSTTNALSSTFENGVTQVYSAPILSTGLGLNTYNFQTPFIWDCTSNIIVQICWSNNNFGSSGILPTEVKYDVTPFFSTNKYLADNQPATVICGQPLGNNSSPFAFRPKTTFTSTAVRSVSWSPLGTLYFDANAATPYTGGNSPTVYAKPSTTTMYYATITGPCSNSTDSCLVIVNQPTSSTQAFTACDFFYWDPMQGGTGQTYTSSGAYFNTIKNAANCDSTITLMLIINQSITSSTNVTDCDSYLWPISQGGTGQTYTIPGVYTNTTTDPITGCNNTTTLNLTLYYTRYIDTFVIACDTFYWDGNYYSTSGDYIFTTTDINGICTIITTLHLTINHTVTTYFYDSVCQKNLPYVWHGLSYTSPGTYADTIHRSGNCDSIVLLILTLKPCPGDCCPSITNLVQNGNFELGNAHFTAIDYSYEPSPIIPGKYGVLTSLQANALSPSSWNPDCISYGKHLIINGRTGLGFNLKKAVWSQTMFLVEGATYSFCANFKSLDMCGLNVQPKIDIIFPALAGNIMGRTIPITTDCNWYTIRKDFVYKKTGNFPNISINLYEDGKGDGNDLAIDNIRLVELQKVPAAQLLFNVSFSNVTATTFNMTATPVTPLNGCTPYWVLEELDKNFKPVLPKSKTNPTDWLSLSANNFPGYSYIPPVYTAGSFTPGLFDIKKRYRITYGRTCDCTVINIYAVIVDPTIGMRGGKNTIRVYEDKKYMDEMNNQHVENTGTLTPPLKE